MLYDPEAQAMQASTPPTEYVPDVHGTSAVFNAFAYFPAPAVVHDEAAVVEEYIPLAQFLHALAPPTEYVPAAHSRQSIAAEFEYRPGEHGVHKFWAPFDIVPEGHAEQHDLKMADGSQSSADGYCILYALMVPAEEEEQEALAAEFIFP